MITPGRTDERGIGDEFAMYGLDSGWAGDGELDSVAEIGSLDADPVPRCVQSRPKASANGGATRQVGCHEGLDYRSMPKATADGGVIRPVLCHGEQDLPASFQSIPKAAANGGAIRLVGCHEGPRSATEELTSSGYERASGRSVRWFDESELEGRRPSRLGFDYSGAYRDVCDADVE